MKRSAPSHARWVCIPLVAASALACGGGGGGAVGPATDPKPLQVTESVKPAPAATGQPASTAPAAPATGTATATAPVTAPVTGTAPATAPATAPKPKTAAECKALITKTPPPTITTTDTQTQFREHFQAYHETFRCCFDALFAPSNPGVSGKVALVVNIDAAGSFGSAEILAAETSVQSTEVQACIIEIAKALSYPKPASGKDIRYQRNFDFKARR